MFYFKTIEMKIAYKITFTVNYFSYVDLKLKSFLLKWTQIFSLTMGNTVYLKKSNKWRVY